MKRRNSRNPSAEPSRAPIPHRRELSDAPAPAWETPALIGTASLIIARCLFTQSLRSIESILPGQILAPATPGAAAALAMDSAIISLAIVVALARVVHARRWRQPLGLIGGCQAIFLALGGFMVASTAWAADKFAALVSGADLLSAASSLWLISTLVHTHRRFRLIVGATLGLLLVFSIFSLNYRLVDLPNLRDRWTQDIDGTRTKLLEANGWQETDVAAQQYARNLMTGSLMGYNQSANTFAAQIVLLTGAVLGLILHRIGKSNWTWQIVPIVAACAVPWMIYHTGSRTALGTMLLMLVIVGLLRPTIGWISQHHKLVYRLGVAAAIGVIALVVMTGLVRGNLLHDSLTFRWQYWMASLKLWEAHPILGVGSANFGDFYLQYRLPVAPEEVRDPHNLLVRFFSEGGIIAGGLAIAFLLTLAWQLTRPLLPAADAPEVRLAGHEPEKTSGLGIMLAIPILSVLMGVLIGVDFGTDVSFVIVQCYMAGIFLIMMILGSLAGSIESFGSQQVDPNPSPWLVRGVVVGIGLFMLHGMMDIAFFEAGPLHLLMLLAGGVLGLRQAAARQLQSAESPDQPLRRTGIVLGGLITLGILWLLGVSLVVGPAMAAEAMANQANQELADNRPVAAVQSYQRAARWMPLNGQYAYRAAGAMELAQSPAESILAEYAQAIDAEPMNIRYLLGRARFRQMLNRPNYELILADYARVMELNPNDVHLRIEYARALASAGQSAHAVEQLKLALWYNDQLRPTEIKRLPADRVKQVQAEIARLSR